MNVVLYQMKDDKKIVNKTLTTISEKNNCYLKDSTSLINPRIVLTIPTTMSEFNYFKLDGAPFFGRYYYVTNITTNNEGISVVEGHIDVLMSHKSELLLEHAIIGRQKSMANGYLVDPRWNISSKTKTVTKLFPKAIGNKTTTIITVLGG